MRAIFDAADGNYGVPRMFTELRRAGLVVNRKKGHRLMRLHGMAGRFRRRTVRTTFPGPDGYQIPDLVGRRFAPGAPDVAWAQDVTYVPTGEGWLFLASVLDLGSRRMLGYSMADRMRTELVLDALGMAAAARGGDNAVAESFWESLKRECLQGRVFATRAEARRAIFRWNGGRFGRPACRVCDSACRRGDHPLAHTDRAEVQGYGSDTRRRMFASSRTASAAIPASRRQDVALCLTDCANSTAERTSRLRSASAAPASSTSTNRSMRCLVFATGGSVSPARRWEGS